MQLSSFRILSAFTLRHARATTYVALLIAVAGACGGSGASPTQPPRPDEVVIRRLAFTPSARTVASGTRVTWSNQDGEAHTVTGDQGPERWDSGVLAGGNAYSRTFTVPGTYQYSCSIHPEMRGSIIVGQAAYRQSEDEPVALLALQRP